MNKSTNKKHNITIFLLAFVIVGFLGFWIGRLSVLPKSTPAQTTLKTMNSWYPYTEDPRIQKQLPYLTYQIRFPASYYVTDGATLEDYQSMGSGGGTPSIVLTKGSQFTADQHINELYGSNTPCILIWRQPAVDIEAILPENDIKLTASEKKIINNHTVILRTLEHVKTKHRTYMALVHLPEDVLYGFETCNDTNKNDLFTVLMESPR